MDLSWRLVIKDALLILGVLGVILGGASTIGKSMAEDFIEDVIDLRIKKLEDNVEALQFGQQANGTALSLQDEKLNTIKELQTEQRNDMKILLLRSEN